MKKHASIDSHETYQTQFAWWFPSAETGVQDGESILESTAGEEEEEGRQEFKALDSVSAYIRDIRRLEILDAQEQKCNGMRLQTAKQNFLNVLLGCRATFEWLGCEEGRRACHEMTKEDWKRVQETVKTVDGHFERMQKDGSLQAGQVFAKALRYLQGEILGNVIHCGRMFGLLEKLQAIQLQWTVIRARLGAGELGAERQLENLEAALWIPAAGMEAFFAALSESEKEFTLCRNRLVQPNLPLVVNVAKKLVCSRMRYEDLIQEGNVVLLDIAEMYEPGKASFSTFAKMKLEYGLKRALDDRGPQIGRPVHVSAKLRKLLKRRGELSEQLGRECTEAELAAVEDESVGEVQILLACGMEPDSLDRPVAPGGGTLMESLDASVAFEGDRTRLMAGEDAWVKRALSLLAGSERVLVEKAYGFGMQKGATIRQLAIQLGCSQREVEERLNLALQKMREASGFGPGEDFPEMEIAWGVAA